MKFDWTLLDASHLGMLAVGVLASAIAYLLKRLITGAAAQERIARYSGITDIAAKMKEHGLTDSDVAAVEAFARGKRREVELSRASVPAALELTEESSEPDGYWTQSAMNRRAGAALNTAMAQLQQTLLELEHYLGDELWQSQEAWETYLERQTALARSEYEGGTIAPMMVAAEGEALTLQRLDWAKAKLEELRER